MCIFCTGVRSGVGTGLGAGALAELRVKRWLNCDLVGGRTRWLVPFFLLAILVVLLALAVILALAYYVARRW
jgi:hypothetical protein